MMLTVTLFSLILNVFGQRYPEPFDNDNLQFQQRRSTHARYDLKAMYDELDELDDRIKSNDKWEEFKVLATQLKEEAQNKPNYNWHDDLRQVLAWSRTLSKPKHFNDMSRDHVDSRPIQKPSAGMGAYWGDYENDEVKSKSRKLPTPGPNIPRFLPGKQVMNAALRKLQDLNQMNGLNIQTQLMDVKKKLPDNQLKSETTGKQINKSILPKEDDFKAPIRWVALHSNDTRDGLAKVTDPNTGRNLHFVVNGTILVPIIDYNLERLGLTTTTSLPVLTTDGTSLRTVVRNVDLKNVDESDWLVYETALGGRNDSNECNGDGCQARCKRLGCESVCTGDTCASGCIGGHCSTFCKGPGCFAMCVGEGCSAKCVGISCDSRCRGAGCEAGCRSFSCRYVVNGKSSFGGGAWGEHYPQYDTANIRRPDY